MEIDDFIEIRKIDHIPPHRCPQDCENVIAPIEWITIEEFKKRYPNKHKEE